MIALYAWFLYSLLNGSCNGLPRHLWYYTPTINSLKYSVQWSSEEDGRYFMTNRWKIFGRTLAFCLNIHQLVLLHITDLLKLIGLSISSCRVFAFSWFELLVTLLGVEQGNDSILFRLLLAYVRKARIRPNLVRSLCLARETQSESAVRSGVSQCRSNKMWSSQLASVGRRN